MLSGEVSRYGSCPRFGGDDRTRTETHKTYNVVLEGIGKVWMTRSGLPSTSSRYTTRPEDIAYSLFGMFNQ